MFGCLRRLGCLAIVAVVALAAFVTREAWLPRVTGKRPTTAVAWQETTAERGEKARRVVQSLETRTGPAYANLTPGELSSLVLVELRKRFPVPIEQSEAAVIGNQLSVRGTVDLRALGGLESLGPLREMIGTSPQRLALTGDLNVVEPGFAEFRIADAKVGDLIVPRPLIPTLIARLDRGPRPAGTARGAIAFPIPNHVGDIRIANGRVTLYKHLR